MEHLKSKSFLESELYVDPVKALSEVVYRIGDERGQILSYLTDAIVARGDAVKGPVLQEKVKPLLEQLLEDGKVEEAGLLFNIHRILTQFQGYGANESASSDVDNCFNNGLEIPEKGLIVVDFFVTRNLPKIVEVCKANGVDLGRIRVCAPKGVLAAQLMQMSLEKRKEFESACGELKEDQFIVDDVNHNADLSVNAGEDGVAIWFSPRTMAITPKLHAETEQGTVNDYRSWFRDKIADVVQGGRVYANMAYSKEWNPLNVEVVEGKRTLTKLSGMSQSVAVSVVKLLIEELGFDQLGRGEFNPKQVNSEVDHAKMADELHVVKL